MRGNEVERMERVSWEVIELLWLWKHVENARCSFFWLYVG